MFRWFKKKPRPATDQLVALMYGDPPPPKSADVTKAVQLAHQDLLGGLIDEREVRELASALYEGPIPYTTHDLALSTALNFFRRPDQHERLKDVQISARVQALEWAKQKKIPPLALHSFEDSLYTRYRPKPDAHKRETVTYADVGYALAQRLYPETILKEIEDGGAYVPTEERAFIALASLSVTGAVIAMRQLSVAQRMGEAVIESILIRLYAALPYTFTSRHGLTSDWKPLVNPMLELAARVGDAFDEQSDSKPPLPLPHWFASKEALAYLHNAPPLNPEEIMVFSEYLFLCVTASKQYLDELLSGDVTIVGEA